MIITVIPQIIVYYNFKTAIASRNDNSIKFENIKEVNGFL